MQSQILIVGGGVAGAVLAYWLARGGAKVLLVERSSSQSKLGQGIDIEGPAREIVRRMGVMEHVKAAATGEKGAAVVDDDNQIIAWIPGGITRDIEVMRGDLTEILLTAARQFNDVTIQYGRTVTELVQTESEVSVTFDNGQKQDFTAVVAADGLRSKTRDLIFEFQTAQNAIKPLDCFTAYFSIPYQRGDEKLSRIQNASGGRSIFVRPVDGEKSSAYVTKVAKSSKLERALREGPQAQKEAMKETFIGIKGLAPRVLDEMLATENFYFERISQVRLTRWSNGRSAVLGDAAYAPSPLTGAGTKLAIVGAYVMAGELLQSVDNPAAAFEGYESRCRAFVEDSQSIPLGGYAPNLLNPQTRWGIWILRAMFMIFAWSGLWRLFGGQGSGKEEDVGLPPWIPDYPHLYRK